MKQGNRAAAAALLAMFTLAAAVAAVWAAEAPGAVETSGAAPLSPAAGASGGSGAQGAAQWSPKDFAYGLKVITPAEAAAYRVSLPLVVYQRLVRADLGDLRVFNQAGDVVPYAIERPNAEASVQPASVRLPVFTLRGDAAKALEAVRVTIESGTAKVNVQISGGTPAPNADATPLPVTSYVLDGRALEAPVAVLQIAWPDDALDFAGRLQVEASDDLGEWHVVAGAAPIANLRAGEARLIERRVELPPTRTRYWRLTWAGDAAPFEITSVIAEPARGRVDVERATLAVTGTPARDERPEAKAGDTKPGEFEFDLGARMPVDRVNIELPEQNSVVELALFSRASSKDVWRSVTRNGFYRLKSANGDLTNGAVTVAPDGDRYWLARADAGSAGLGRGAPQLRVGWLPHDVVFLARGAGPYVLAYGSGDAVSAAASLGSMPSAVTITRAQLAEPHTLGGEPKLKPSVGPDAPFPWNKVLLWAALVIGVALLAFMAYRLARELK